MKRYYSVAPFFVLLFAGSIFGDVTNNYISQSLKVSTPPNWHQFGFKERTMDKSAPFTSQVQHDLEKLRLYFNDKSTTANRDDIVTLAQLIQPVAGECPQIDTVLSLIPMVFYVSKAPDSNLLIEPLRARFTDLKGKGAIYTTVRLMLLDCLIALKDKSQVSETLEIYASEQEQDLKDWSQRCLRKMGYELPFEEEKPQPKSSTAKP